MSTRAYLLVASLFTMLLVCTLMLSEATAFGSIGYLETSSFAPPEGFGRPYGLAIDNSTGLSDSSKGVVYVGDRPNERIDEFSASGVLLAQASVPGVTLGQMTVADGGPYEGDLYVAGESNGVIYRYTPGFTTREEVVTGLESPSDVAIDAAGEVFVTEAFAMKVLEFNSADQPIDSSGAVVAAGENTAVTVEHPAQGSWAPELVSLAVDPAGTTLYAGADEFFMGYPETLNAGDVIKYTLSSGKYAENDSFSNVSRSGLWAVALGSNGDIYTLQEGRGYKPELFVYDPTGSLVGVGAGNDMPEQLPSHGIAVSAESGDVYASNGARNVIVLEGGEKPQVPITEASSALVGTQVTFNGTLAGGETGFYFEYNLGPNCEGGQRTTPGAASGSQQVHVEVGELARQSQYSVCLVATNKYGVEVGTSLTFETGLSQPRISNETSSATSSTADLGAYVDPEGLPTKYYFEYGPAVPYESRTSELTLNPGEAFVSVRATLTELAPGAEYHFRLVATNEVGRNAGQDQTFVTYSSVPAGLPDGRVYEMVTPVDNPYDMEVYEPGGILETSVPFRSSLDGNSVVYAGLPSEAGTGAQGEEGGDQYRAVRSTQGGWTQHNITPPGGAFAEKYVDFSPDLEDAIIPEGAAPPFGLLNAITQPAQPYTEVYQTTMGEEEFRPLFGATPPDRRPLGEGGPHTSGGDNFMARYAGASADFSHLLLEANDLLVEGSGQAETELAAKAKKEGEIGMELAGLETEVARYHQEGNETESNRLDGIAELLPPSASQTDLYLSIGGHDSLVSVLPEGRLAVGAVFGGLPSQRYSEELGRNSSGAISSDGSRIFWSSVVTTPNKTASGYVVAPGGVYVRIGGLRTEAVSAGPAEYWTATPDGRYAYYVEAGNLWRFDVESQKREEIASGQAEVQGVIGINRTGEDGAYVYFVAKRSLTGEANSVGQEPQAGADNLYVSEPDPAHPGGHVTKFIATLSSGDSADWTPFAGSRTAQVAADGRSVVFSSGLNLVGHPYPGEGSGEVYDFRTTTDSVFCVSCRPQASGGLILRSENDFIEHRWVSEDGDRVFFDSEAPLVAQDTNGVNDVYEWEPDGVGACQEGEGCVYLISGGVESTAFFADASANGDDVFIATRQRLVPEDENEMADLYDARVGGVRAITPPQCTGTGCQGVPAAPPIFATPSSETFSGVGNLAPTAHATVKRITLSPSHKLARALAACHKQRAGKTRKRCETHARRLYGHAKDRSVAGKKGNK